MGTKPLQSHHKFYLSLSPTSVPAAMGEAQHLTGLQPCTASQMLHKVKHTGWRVAGMVGGSNHFCIQYARKPPTPDTTSQVTH